METPVMSAFDIAIQRTSVPSKVIAAVSLDCEGSLDCDGMQKNSCVCFFVIASQILHFFDVFSCNSETFFIISKMHFCSLLFCGFIKNNSVLGGINLTYNIDTKRIKKYRPN